MEAKVSIYNLFFCGGGASNFPIEASSNSSLRKISPSVSIHFTNFHLIPLFLFPVKHLGSPWTGPISLKVNPSHETFEVTLNANPKASAMYIWRCKCSYLKGVMDSESRYQGFELALSRLVLGIKWHNVLETLCKLRSASQVLGIINKGGDIWAGIQNITESCLLFPDCSAWKEKLIEMNHAKILTYLNLLQVAGVSNFSLKPWNVG